MKKENIVINIKKLNLNYFNLVIEKFSKNPKYLNKVVFRWNLDSDDKSNNVYLKNNCFYEDLTELKNIEYYISNILITAIYTNNFYINKEFLEKSCNILSNLILSRVVTYSNKKIKNILSNKHDEDYYLYETNFIIIYKKLYKKLIKIIAKVRLIIK